MRIDLHIHSTASDGSLAPADVVRSAAAGALDVIAITDHDTIDGYGEACRAGSGSVHVIPAIEISTTYESAELHMLGYFVDHRSPVLASHERDAATRRRERMIAILETLRGSGLDVDFEAVATEAGGARVVARPHLARVLVRRGYAHTVSDAFDRWIGNACPAFQPVDLVSPEAAIQRVHQAGGIAVWAHPDSTVFRREGSRFVAWGLDGVECFRPRCSAEECIALEKSTLELGLLVSGGSDWHGPWSGRLGAFALSREELGPLLERGGI